jgi:hypothetical protein
MNWTFNANVLRGSFPCQKFASRYRKHTTWNAGDESFFYLAHGEKPDCSFEKLLTKLSPDSRRPCKPLKNNNQIEDINFHYERCFARN